jgi:hypothetical protein
MALITLGCEARSASHLLKYEALSEPSHSITAKNTLRLKQKLRGRARVVFVGLRQLAHMPNTMIAKKPQDNPMCHGHTHARLFNIIPIIGNFAAFNN